MLTPVVGTPVFELLGDMRSAPRSPPTAPAKRPSEPEPTPDIAPLRPAAEVAKQCVGRSQKPPTPACVHRQPYSLNIGGFLVLSIAQCATAGRYSTPVATQVAFAVLTALALPKSPLRQLEPRQYPAAPAPTPIATASPVLTAAYALAGKIDVANSSVSASVAETDCRRSRVRDLFILIGK